MVEACLILCIASGWHCLGRHIKLVHHLCLSYIVLRNVVGARCHLVTGSGVMALGIVIVVAIKIVVLQGINVGGRWDWVLV